MQQTIERATDLVRMTARLYLELATSALSLVPSRRSVRGA